MLVGIPFGPGTSRYHDSYLSAYTSPTLQEVVVVYTEIAGASRDDGYDAAAAACSAPGALHVRLRRAHGAVALELRPRPSAVQWQRQ